MALSNEDLLKELSAKSIMEVVGLVKMLEDEWGVSAAAPVAAAAGPAAGGDAGDAAVEKDEFDVVLTSFGGQKLASSRPSVQSRGWVSKRRRTLSKALLQRLKKVCRKQKLKRSRSGLRKPAQASNSSKRLKRSLLMQDPMVHKTGKQLAGLRLAACAHL